MRNSIIALSLALLLEGCNAPPTQTGEGAQTDTVATDTRTGDQDEMVGRAVVPETPGIATPQAGEADDAQLPDDKAAQKAYAGDFAEVQLAELALDKTQNEKVRELATTIREDHQKANQELDGLAGDLKVTLDKQLNSEQQSLKEKLSSLDGDEFDKQYVSSMVDEHEKDLRFYRQESQDTQDDKLRGYFEKTSSIIAGHLEKANEINLSGSESNT